MYLYIQFLQMRYCCSFLVENLFVCVRASTAKRILCINHRNRKVVGGTYNVLVHHVNDCAPNLSDVVLCNPFKWDTLLFISDQNLGFFFFRNHYQSFPVTDLTWVAIFDIIDWDVFRPVFKQEAHSSKRDTMVTQILHKEATNRREGKQKRSLSWQEMCIMLSFSWWWWSLYMYGEESQG